MTKAGHQTTEFLFANPDGISAYFSPSAKRVERLTDYTTRKFPDFCATRWNFNQELVDAVCF